MDDAPKSLPRHLGLDLGKRRIGVAASDLLGGRSRPLPVIERRNDQQAVEAIARLMDAYEIRVCVAGLPLNMDGSEGAQAKISKDLATELERQGAPQVQLWDERLTSFQADEVMIAAGVRASRRKKLRDALSAQIILQSFLDARRAEPPTRSTTPP